MTSTSTSTSTSTDLLALGLTEPEAQVLSVVLERIEVAPSDLAGMLALSRQVISKAIASLESRGILDRVHRRRPTTVFLHAQAEQVIAGLARARTGERQEQQARAERAVASLASAAQQRLERGRPYFELEPPLRSEHDTHLWPSRFGRSSHIEVLAGHELVSAGVPAGHVRLRVLLTGDLSQADRWARTRLLRSHAEVRLTTEPLPRLLLLDGERAGIHAGTVEGYRRVWTQDRGHVRALVELFELWWSRAEPVARLARPVEQPCDVDGYDVDEWDAADLPDGLRSAPSGDSLI